MVVQTPVYNIFFNSIVNNGRNVLENKLRLDGEEYHIDFEDLEEKLSNPQTTLMILCNPHNPIGKIWDKETLERIRKFCDFIRKEAGLYLSDGNGYRNGEGFLRMNIACPKSVVQDGVIRLKKSIPAYTKWVVSQC